MKPYSNNPEGVKNNETKSEFHNLKTYVGLVPQPTPLNVFFGNGP
jgi:hypothetical protein